MPTVSADMSLIFKALADKNRLKILFLIYQGKCKCKEEDFSKKDLNEHCVKSFATKLKISVPTASHHVKELFRAGLITTEKKGRWVYCHLNKHALKKISSLFAIFEDHTLHA